LGCSRQPALLRHEGSKLLISGCVLVVASLTLMRGIFAAMHPLRVDEAYYWTWSRESVISCLDHPPMVAWCIYFGTQIFGDTNFGVRFSGLLAMLVMQVLLADIVLRTTRDWRYAILAVLPPEAALNYGLRITRVVPDTPLIAFALATVWALDRLALSGNQRWWLGRRVRRVCVAVKIPRHPADSGDCRVCNCSALANEAAFF